MNIEERASELTELLRRLLEACVVHPNDLSVEYYAMRNRVDWKIRANVNDQGRLVGKRGAHIQAVQFLMRELGVRDGNKYVVTLESDGVGERKLGDEDYFAPSIQKTNAMTIELLAAVLKEFLDEDAKIEIFNRIAEGDGVLFRINPVRMQDYEALVSPPDGRSNQTLLTELGTLFRAIGRGWGINLSLEVPSK